MGGKHKKSTASGGFDAFLALLRDKKRRPVAVRYLAVIATTVLSLLYAALPTVAFRTAGGDSDPHSLYYWMNAVFYGRGGTKGAYESLVGASAGNQSLDFYRAVIVTYLVAAVLLLVGSILSVLISVGACYLLVTEESTDFGKRLGRLYRVALGDRAVTLLPPALAALPLLFPRLLAYYYTALLSSETKAVFTPLDPFIVAGILLLVDLLILLYVKNTECLLKYDIFRSPAKRVTAEDKRRREEAEWEAAVDADRTRTEEPQKRHRETEKTEEKPPETRKKPEKAENSPAPEDESLYGRKFVVGTEAPSVLPKQDGIGATDGEGARTAEEAKRTDAALRSLFDGDAEEDAPKQKRKKGK